MGRAEVPCVYDEGYKMELGGSSVLREGSDVSIIACGVEVNEALIAADMLAEQGISAEVIDAFSIKPLDEASILASAAKTGFVVTAEEHSVIGGLGSAVCELLAEKLPCPCKRIGMQDVFGTSGSFEELLVHFDMDGAAIVEAVKTLRANPKKC
ncbi:MAG: transketolase C-terminal domain-containing protein [Raoultibacter sp.]